MDFLTEHATIIGLIFFFGFFCGLIAWVFLPGSSKKFKDYGEIPLKENGDDKK
jgi:cbb3-type cytochrome oxidase subunit 3